MDRADVIILGGGLVGLALAAALDSSGLSTIVIDPVDPNTRTNAAFDGRTSASSSSRRMFDTVGITDHFPEPGCPIRRIEVADGLEPAAWPSIQARMKNRSASCTRTGTCGRRCWPGPRRARTSG